MQRHGGVVFHARWDGALIVWTVVFTLVVGCAGTGAFLAGMSAPPLGRALVSYVPIAFIAAVYAIVWALAPRAFIVRPASVAVRRWVGGFDIALADVRSVRVLPPGFLRGSIRTFGVGGLFGYYGRFMGRQLGSYRMYATRSTGHVAIETVDRPIVVTPDDPARFVAEVEARLRARR